MAEAHKPAEFFCSINVGAAPSETDVPVQPVAAHYDSSIGHLLAAIIEQNRELVALSRKQLEISQRMEDRFEKQVEAQREEFVRWMDDIPGLSARGKHAAESLRELLGSLIDEFVAYVDENRDNLSDSDFVRAEMVDKYGQMLNHISSMYGMLKRLSTAEENGSNS